MANRDKLSNEAVDAFVAEHPGWARAGDMLVKTFSFGHYGQGVAFAVHVGFAAEKKDHHPNLHIFWGKVTVEWSTHDAGGITELDTKMAELTDKIYEG